MKDYAIYISFAALIVSAFSLGWNFYRDVILKPRLKVRITISEISDGTQTTGPLISLAGVNLGPGPIICNGILALKKTWRRYLGRKPEYHYIVEDYTNPLSNRFPKKLEVGETVHLYLPYNHEAFLNVDPTKVAIRDTFSKLHYASRKSLKETKKNFFKEFGPR
jgi:hypothetical protein